MEAEEEEEEEEKGKFNCYISVLSQLDRDMDVIPTCSITLHQLSTFAFHYYDACLSYAIEASMRRTRRILKLNEEREERAADILFYKSSNIRYAYYR